MKIIIKEAGNLPRQKLQPSEPLHKRVPTKDKDGNRLFDFMMLIPKLKNQPDEQIQLVIKKIQKVFKLYDEVIVFADLNLKLNLLWVSVKPRQGLLTEIPAAIHQLVPEAKLVGEYIKKK